MAKPAKMLPGPTLTADWLIATEARYGGHVTGIPRVKTSPRDPRSAAELATGGMIGGDRMHHHGYAAKYAEYLAPKLYGPQVHAVAEFGILRGTGLALWCDLFLDAHVLGFDIDLGHYEDYLPTLTELGAFELNSPTTYLYDQFEVGAAELGDILDCVGTLDVVIDDGHHSEAAIMTTLASVRPHLSREFVYFIEDNRHVHEVIRDKYPEFTVDVQGELTILT